MSDEATVDTVEATPEEVTEAQPESAPAQQAGAEEPEGKAEKNVPLAKFIELRRQAQALKAELDAAKQPKEPDNKQPLDPERRKAIRELIREADPDAFETVEAIKAERQEREEAMLDDAEETIRELVKESGLPGKEAFVARLGYHVMSEIREDAKLMRQWKAGNVGVVKKAFDRYMTDYVGELKKTTTATNGAAVAAIKRAGARVPTPPPGGSSVASGAPKRPDGDFGLTKHADDLAWKVFQDSKGS